EKNVRAQRGRVIPFSRIIVAGWNSRIEVDPSIELHQDVLGRSVGAGDETQIRSTRYPGNRVRIGITARHRPGDAVRIEIRITVRAVFAQISQRAGRLAALQNRDRLSTRSTRPK